MKVKFNMVVVANNVMLVCFWGHQLQLLYPKPHRVTIVFFIYPPSLVTSLSA